MSWVTVRLTCEGTPGAKNGSRVSRPEPIGQTRVVSACSSGFSLDRGESKRIRFEGRVSVSFQQSHGAHHRIRRPMTGTHFNEPLAAAWPLHGPFMLRAVAPS